MQRNAAWSCVELRSLYIEQGLGVAAIATLLGCSPPTVSNRLRRCGITARQGRFAPCVVPREQLEQLYCVEGLTLREIARRLGVSVGTVNNRRRAYGIPPRTSRRRS